MTKEERRAHWRTLIEGQTTSGKFDEAASSRPGEATDILARIARLYHEIETPCANMIPEERRLCL